MPEEVRNGGRQPSLLPRKSDGSLVTQNIWVAQTVPSQAQSESVFYYFVSPSWAHRLRSDLSLQVLGLSRMLTFFSLLDALNSSQHVQVALGLRGGRWGGRERKEREMGNAWE